jgi:hypothetical protein
LLAKPTNGDMNYTIVPFLEGSLSLFLLGTDLLER